MKAGDLAVPATHDPFLVALSVIVSSLGAYAAIQLAEGMRDARGRIFVAWLLGAATVDGIGTGSMHYTAKLALRLPFPLQFDWRMVVLSLLVSITGSAAALLFFGHGSVRWWRAVAGGILLGGIGISGLHYTGMAAILFPPAPHPPFLPTLL